MNRTVLSTIVAGAVIATSAVALAQVVPNTANTDPHAQMASMVCRPAAAAEKPVAMSGSVGLLCKKMNVAVAVKGPDISAARTAEEADRAWRDYIQSLLEVRSGDGGG